MTALITGQRVVQETESRGQLNAPMPIDLYQAQTTAGTVFTARTDADFLVRSLIASNVTATADYITVYIVASGGSPGATNLYVYQKAVPAKDYVAVFDETRTALVPPGATIRVLCGVNDAINVFGWGYDQQGAYG